MTTDIARADAADRAAKAWRLRVAGATWEDVAKIAGYSNKANAYRAVKRYFNGVPQVDLDMLRGVARARAEALWLRAFKAVESSDGSPAQVRAAVAVLERQARLDGLDAPTERIIHAPGQEEFQEFIAAAARGMGLAVIEEGDPFEDVLDAEVVEGDSDS